MKLIERTFYLNKLINIIGTPDIKVITGVRRCGKSKLLESFIDYIKNNVDDNNIIHINFNLLKFKDLKEGQKLYEYITSSYLPEKHNFVIIDEVQLCDDFEKIINSLHAEEQYDIYITGSNAFLLSSDLATLFTGRTFEIEVFPFSFKEFLTYFDYSDIINSFDKYFLEGGFSGSYLYKDIDDKYNYVKDIYNTLIVRDITNKYNIRNSYLMDNLTDYLMDNISNLTSTRKIADTLSNKNEKINHKTISKYIDYLCNAFVFYKFRRYDIKGKKSLASQDKYYLSDHSLKYARLGTKNLDYGRAYENIVAMELKRRGYEVYVGILHNKEIDFVAIKKDKKIYIQVSDDISNDKTFEREVSPLLNIKDAYPKVLVARTKHDTYQYEGIMIIDIANWLVENDS